MEGFLFLTRTNLKIVELVEKLGGESKERAEMRD